MLTCLSSSSFFLSLQLSLCVYSVVGGIPLPEIVKMGLISQKEVDEIVQRTRDGGGEIVS